MTEIPAFEGFPETTFRFFRQLAANNNRDWFQAHKQDYVDNVQTPAQAFVVAFGERLGEISPGIAYDPRAHGGSLMRIYRDIRFSKDKSPYKTHLGINFWEGDKKSGKSGFHFYMDATGARLYTGMHEFSKEKLQAYRKAVDHAKWGLKLEAAVAEVTSQKGYSVGGEQLKRVPAGFDAEHPRADLLRFKGLYGQSPALDLKTLGSQALVDACLKHGRALAPLHRWFGEAM